ncbi:2Fe-2S iron-sulfur cluster-binding protein [Endozoicomonas euniceicola]|uniref:2Fe-2S iron-sulfur cluster-binding protein n=1 Tax=Endozoicomonas euniceicola TaxID=1234143 RepID=UPI00385169D5
MFFKRSRKLTIKYNGNEIQTKESKTILTALLRNNEKIKYSCGSGECKQCRFHLISGNIKSKRNAGPMLACQSYPDSDIEIIQY